MADNEKLIRDFYQGLRTEEEKEFYKKLLSMTPHERKIALIETTLPILSSMDAETYVAVTAIAKMTRKEITVMFAQKVRESFFEWLWKKIFG